MTESEPRDQSGNTPEYVVQEAIYEHDDSWDLNEHIVAALRNEGMLAEGAPADEQVEAATWALIASDTDTSDRGVSDEHYRERRADVERIAPILLDGVATPAPSARTALLNEVIATHEGQVSTHFEGCYRDHAACLAVRIRESERAGEGIAPQEPREERCWCFDLPRGEHHPDCEPAPAPSAERETLITSLRRVAAVLEEYEFEDHASEAAGLMNSAAEVLAAPDPARAPDPAPASDGDSENRKCAWCEAAACGAASWQGDDQIDHPSCGEHGFNFAPAPREDRERRALNRVWAAMGCAWNPEEFRTSERDSMWKQIIEWCEEQTAGNTRIYRENQQLQSAVLAARAPVDEAKLAEVIREKQTWTKRMSDGYLSTGSNSPEEIARAVREYLDSLRGEGR